MEPLEPLEQSWFPTELSQRWSHDLKQQSYWSSPKTTLSFHKTAFCSIAQLFLYLTLNWIHFQSVFGAAFQESYFLAFLCSLRVLSHWPSAVVTNLCLIQGLGHPSLVAFCHNLFLGHAFHRNLKRHELLCSCRRIREESSLCFCLHLLEM